MAGVNFEASTSDLLLIEKIAVRARKTEELKIAISQLHLMMDITAVHCNGCPLRLEELLNAKDTDFFHDVVGIMNKLDRPTGKLRDLFEPRCAYATHV